MKLIGIFFVLVAFTFVKAMIINDSAGQDLIVFPTLELPETEFIDLSGGCGGFTDCIEYVGAVLQNIGTGIIAIVLFFIALATFIYELVVLIVQVTFTGIDGAPLVVNALLTLPFLGGLGIITYKLLRKGDDDA